MECKYCCFEHFASLLYKISCSLLLLFLCTIMLVESFWLGEFLFIPPGQPWLVWCLPMQSLGPSPSIRSHHGIAPSPLRAQRRQSCRQKALRCCQPSPVPTLPNPQVAGFQNFNLGTRGARFSLPPFTRPESSLATVSLDLEPTRL